jgi:hypothetical protein
MRDSTSYALSLTSSAVERMLLPVIPDPEPTGGVVGGAWAYFRACTLQAAIIASAAANKAAAVDTAHTMLLENIQTCSSRKHLVSIPMGHLFRMKLLSLHKKRSKSKSRLMNTMKT